MTPKRCLKYWLAGFTVGGLLCCVWHLLNSGQISLSPGSFLFLEDFTYLLWPSSLMLIPLSSRNPISIIVIESISLVTNGVIYLGVGYIFVKILRTGTSSEERAKT